MQPTTYVGDAIIDGQEQEAELHLDSAWLSLVLPDGSEVLRWPIDALGVEPDRSGGYHLRSDKGSFVFAPEVDDGLDAEIGLRRRLSPPGSPTPMAQGGDLVPPPNPPARHAQEGQKAPSGHRRRSLDIKPTTALGVLVGIGVVVLGVALATGSLSPTVRTPELSSPLDLAAESDSTAITPSTAAPTTTPVSEPEVAGVTVTTTPPATTEPAPTTSAPESETTAPTDSPAPPPDADIVSAWNTLAGDLSGEVEATDPVTSDGATRFRIGDYISVEGAMREGGGAAEIRLVADPSGPTDEDRRILTTLGMVIALAEPDLPPEGRRELIEALGLDLDDPDLAGLDGQIDYRGHSYALFWEPASERLVMEVEALQS